MKKNRSVMACAVMFSLAGAVAQATLLIDYNVDSLTVNTALVGQDGWLNYSSTGGDGPYIRETTVDIGGSPTTIKGVGWLGDNIATRGYRSFGDFGLTSSSTVILEFDLVRVGNNAQAMVGVGFADPVLGGAGLPVTVGSFSTSGFTVREEGEGTQHHARDTNGNNIVPIQGDLYRVRSVWTLTGGGTATLEIKNLSAGDTDFTTLYFDAAQTQSTAPLGLTSDVTTWEHLLVRPGGSSAQGGLITNIEMIPEPGTMALFSLALLGLAVARRMRA